MKRVVVAFLVAPFPTAAVQSVFVYLWPKKGMGVFEHAQSMFLLICLLFYIIELVVAVPVYLAMRKRLPRSMFGYGVAGSMITLIPIVAGLAAAMSRGQISTYALIYDLILFAAGGFVAGAVFWRVTKPEQTVTDLKQTFV